MAESVDAVVIGAGPNGLVAACALADAGWDVVVLEANDTVGGAVRSSRPWAERPDAVVDLFSAFYPLAVASPAIRSLGLEAHGLEWVQAPTVVAHLASPEHEGAFIHRTAAGTAELLGSSRDGDKWLSLVAQWQRLREPLLGALFSPLPPVRSGLSLLRRAGVRETADLARLALSPVTRLGQELFEGDAGRLLFAGNAMHADVPMDGPGSGLFGWLLCMLAQDVGFPVPRGGSGMLSAALRSRAEAAGVVFHTDSRVDQIVIRGGRAVGVLVSGRTFEARRAVLADVDAPRLYNDLVGQANLPERLRADLGRFQWDPPTLKVNWLVEGGIPWSAAAARAAGTVHFGADVDGLARWSGDLAGGRAPARTFALLGQMTTADPSRSPAGTESVWAYTHVASPEFAPAEVTALERRLEEFAPGFGSRVSQRLVQLPGDLEAADANLHHGAINGGTAQLHQQLIFRPTTGLGRPETFLPGLYLAGASAHPGGGVHGACGWNAAAVALRANTRLGPLRDRALHAVLGRL